MNTRKILPTLLFAVLLSITLLACDSGGNAGSANNGAVSQPTSSNASNPPPSNNAATASPAAASGSSSSANAANTGAGGAGAVKLTVVKYVATDNNPGTSTDYLGIIKNDGTTTALQPMFQVVDDSGHTQDIPNTNGLENAILPPGQSAGFNLIYQGADIKHPQFKASGFTLAPAAGIPAQLSVVSSQFTTSSTGVQAVEGEVKNDSDHSVTYWMINVIFYDASGSIVDVNDGSNNDTGPNGSELNLAAHSTSKFHVGVSQPFADASSASGVKATKYDLFVSGYQDP